MGPLFKFYLQQDDTHWYKVVGTAVVTTETESDISTPDHWEDTQLQWGRSHTYWAVLRKFSTQYAFVRDGGDILRWIYFTQGIEGKCRLVIKKRRSFDWTYQDYYSGEIDFSETTVSFTQTVANIMEGGLVSLIKAYENTPFEIPIEDSDCVLTYMDGIWLRGTYNYLVAENDLTQISNFERRYTLLNAHSKDDGDYAVAIAQTTMPQTMGNVTDTDFINIRELNKDNFLLEAVQEMEVTFTLSGQFLWMLRSPNVSTTAALHIDLCVAKDGAAISATYPLYTGLPVSRLIQQDFNLNQVTPKFTLAAGDRLYLVYYWIMGGNTSGLVRVEYNNHEGAIAISSEFRLAPSIVKGYRLLDLAKKLISKMTDGQYTATSPYLLSSFPDYDLRPRNIVASCGDALRGLTSDSNGVFTPPKIKTTLAQLQKTLLNVCGLVMGVEDGNVIFDKIDAFFDRNTRVTDLGDVSFPELSPFSEVFGNTLSVGYQDQTYDTLNGKDEYNTKATFKAPITRKPSDLDFTSEYRADMYGVEILRANLSQKKTTDSSSDNDTFIYEISDEQVTTPVWLVPRRSITSYKLARRQNDAGRSATGLLFPATAFNLALTPGRNLRRKGGFIHMINHLLDGQKLTFQTISKNASLECNLGSGVIKEREDIPIGSLPAPPFLPILIKFQCSRPDLMELLATNPRGYFSFRIKGHEFKGFTDDVGVKPAKEDTYTFSLLLHPDTDLQLLSTALSS